MKTRQYIQIYKPVVDDFTTTSDSYASVPFKIDGSDETRDYWDTWHLTGVKVMLFSATANALKVKILGSLDGTTFSQSVALEFDVTTSAVVEKRIADYWPYLQIQVKPAATGQNGTLKVQAIGTTLPSMADITDGRYIGDIKFGESLPAGTNIIGKVGIDQTTQGTTNGVVVKSSALPTGAATSALQLKKPQTHVNIDFSSASDQIIIAAPGTGKRIWLTRLSLSSGGAQPANVEIAIKSGATTIETQKGSAMVFDYPEHRNLGENEAFVLQATTADRVIGGVDYYVEAV